MPRIARAAPGGMVYDVFNRVVGRRRLFRDDADYAAWERVIEETLQLRQRKGDILLFCS